MDLERRYPGLMTRRELLCRSGIGMGALAMSNLIGQAFAGDDAASLNPLKPRKTLTAWERYAQVLLLANEFMFVD